MIAIVHPTGNAFVRALLRSLESTRTEFRFFTSLALSATSKSARLLPSFLRREFLHRDYEIPRNRIQTRPWRELVRLSAKKLNCSWLTSHEKGWACLDAVYRALDESVALDLRQGSYGQFCAVHAYEDGALQTFKAAKDCGAVCSYELPIAYWETSRALLQEEAQRLPDWEPTLIATRDSQAKLDRKTQEIELADLVVCPSHFVAQTLPLEVRRKRQCIVAPFGSPAVVRKQRKPTTLKRPLRILFAGQMTQRKGLADLFQAIALLKRSDVELVVMGSLLQPLDFYRKRCPNFTYEPPRPHHEFLALMESCDVLVLPSIVEGRALVQQEALSRGLPLIVTANAGAQDLIEEGRTGFLVSIRAPEQLAEKISWVADHRAVLPEMAECAFRKATSVSWSVYADTILKVLGQQTQGMPWLIGDQSTALAN